MTAHPTLNDVIVGFTDWKQPWLFHEYVARSKFLTQTDKTLFEASWAKATDAAHWTSPNLAQCGIAVQLELEKAFPGLNEAAVLAIVNAAAFQWR